jgi:hypothetical protein
VGVYIIKCVIIINLTFFPVVSLASPSSGFIFSKEIRVWETRQQREKAQIFRARNSYTNIESIFAHKQKQNKRR